MNNIDAAMIYSGCAGCLFILSIANFTTGEIVISIVCLVVAIMDIAAALLNRRKAQEALEDTFK
jgi:hypothetical protein